MKTDVIVILLCISVFITTGTLLQNYTDVDKPTDGLSLLLNAIEWVESKGDVNAIGDSGRAVGCMQIHKIYVRDVNRILGYDKYTYADRYDRAKSREMARVYFNHYGGTVEEMAKKFNGGPMGHKKKSTESYWEKVKARMEIRKCGL